MLSTYLSNEKILLFFSFIPRSVKQVSLQMIEELQIVLELSLNKTGVL